MTEGHNVFISYKYGDSNVRPINGRYATARDYVDLLQEEFKELRKVYDRSEHDGEDLSQLSEEAIRSRLSDKIFYTSVTIVLVSPNMDDGRPEKDQWIPWEISYSLKEIKRESGKSGINGVVAVVLPDRNGSYDYVIEDKGCHWSIHDEKLFDIISKNRHNRKVKNPTRCKLCGRDHYDWNQSYVILTNWDLFIKDPEGYIAQAIKLRNECDDFEFSKMS